MGTIDHNRPFLDIIHESAKRLRTYPYRLVEQFETIPRELFVPEILRDIFLPHVHTDHGCGGLLSQPGVIFNMLTALHLEGTEHVFEGGTGTGYQTAILARLCSHVYTVEHDQNRLLAAQQRLDELGIRNVTFVCGDAAYGLPEHAPFERLIFGCAFSGIADQHLLNQMASPRSRLIAPSGTFDHKSGIIRGDLLICDKFGDEIEQLITTAFRGSLSFVPLISPRPIGWTPSKDGYVPSSSFAKKRWFPWLRVCQDGQFFIEPHAK